MIRQPLELVACKVASVPGVVPRIPVHRVRQGEPRVKAAFGRCATVAPVPLEGDAPVAPDLGKAQAHHSAGRTASTPFFFSKTTTNFAGFVLLALRPTVCTSPGPS